MQGTVYLANDPDLERPVAIKILHSDDPTGEVELDASTPLEARISSRLRHPNMVSIFDIGNRNGSVYLVFEYVQGQTLRQLIGSQGKLPIERVCSLAKPILDAIAYAHSEGVIHLDLSPRNILIDEKGNPKVMDFGLSQFLENQRAAEGDEVTGSLLYMSPEHFAPAGTLGTYTDVYALGTILYQLVCGTTPATGDSVDEIVRSIVREAPDMSLIPDGPYKAGFSTFLEGSLQKDTLLRYRDGRAMKEAFRQFSSQHPVDDWNEDKSYRSHSTVQFLLRRMQRKEDFPSMSRVLVEINRLTEGGRSSSADELAEVILKDYGLTSKLLKLVNSPLYARLGGEVTSISRAVVLLGFDQVRSTAYSLAYYSKMHSESASVELRDSMVKSFLSGMLARQIAHDLKLRDTEEAFICGLFQNLGENLVIYYFPEDYAEIRELVGPERADKQMVSCRVLGVRFADIGAEVAKVWQLPDSIVSAIRASVSAESDAAADGDLNETKRLSAIFANELCDLVTLTDPGWQDHVFDDLVSRFGDSLSLEAGGAVALFGEGLTNMLANAAVLDINPAKSPFIISAKRWLTRAEKERSEADTDASAAS